MVCQYCFKRPARRGVLTCSDRCLASLATVVHASSRKSARPTKQTDEEGLIVKTIAFCIVACAVAIYFAVRVFTAVGIAVVAAALVSQVRGAMPFSTWVDAVVMIFSFAAFMWVSRSRPSKVEPEHGGRSTA